MNEITIDCGISKEALRDEFGAYVNDPLPAFRVPSRPHPGNSLHAD